MVTHLSTKELYQLFLESDFWMELSRKRKEVSGWKCNRCGSKDRLESHHVRYPDNWFDTTLDDLECLCRDCHSAHHSQKPQRHERKTFDAPQPKDLHQVQFGKCNNGTQDFLMSQPWFLQALTLTRRELKRIVKKRFSKGKSKRVSNAVTLFKRIPRRVRAAGPDAIIRFMKNG